MILSNYSPTEEDLQNEEFLELNQEASDLYGLIHSRFIITQRGLSKLYNKFLNGIYGNCPRALCDRQKVLPVGLSDELRTSRVKGSFFKLCYKIFDFNFLFSILTKMRRSLSSEIQKYKY